MIGELLARYLASPRHSWSIGIPGAIGEFMYDAGESVDIRARGRRLSALTARGAMQLNVPASARCVAYEALGECASTWTQAVAICLPAGGAAATVRRVLTEEGEDRRAASPAARRERLFDLGLGSPYVRFCVRSGDTRVIASLRAGAGRSLFDPDNPALPTLRDASPARVIISAIGRIEVYQRIPENGSVSPRGPHTHLLPALLRGEPLPGSSAFPPGFVPVLTLYPEHPLFDKYGDPRPFCSAAHEDFQGLLARCGAAEFCFRKAHFSSALLQGRSPETMEPDRAAPEWLAFAIAVRQLPFLQPGRSSRP